MGWGATGSPSLMQVQVSVAEGSNPKKSRISKSLPRGAAGHFTGTFPNWVSSGFAVIFHAREMVENLREKATLPRP
jgi:hypothetical protein